MSAEEAFLASLGGDESGTHNQGPITSVDNDEEEEDYDPSAPAAASPDASIATNTPATAQSEAAASLQVPPQSSRPGSTQPQKQVTIGGFVTEDSDEDEDGIQPTGTAQTNGTVAIESVKSPSQAVPGSVPQTPIPVSAQSLQPPAPPVANGTDLSSSQTPVPAEASADSTMGVSASEVAPSQAAHSLPQATVPSAVSSLPKSRLPNDIIGQLEDRIAEDPKGDVDAWLGLISHLKSRGKYDEVRKIYGRFFETFPTAADQWVAYARMELELDDLPRLEAIFNLSLLKVQSIPLWSIYIDHVRRRNDIVTDASGQGRQIVSQAYEFVLNQVGQDKDSGQIWQDYIAFVKSGPGVPGGTGWQDAQKMDLLRKAYQRAVCVPMSAVSSLWKEYDTFEMGLNKMTGRKFLQEKSPSYMTARGSYSELQSITAGLQRGGIPSLPPYPGCDGEESFMQQVFLWQKWIDWEKDDPLVLKDEDASALQQRILFVYRHATMSLRFWPQIWFDAAQWCFKSGLDADGDGLLDQGLEANPESTLLAFTKADRVENNASTGEGEDGLAKKGAAVRAPYDRALDALYKHLEIVTNRAKVNIARIEERYAAMSPDQQPGSPEPAVGENEDEEDDNTARPQTIQARRERELEEQKATDFAASRLVMKTLTYVWIALMRSMRRIHGKGNPREKVGGMRNIFKESRARGRLTYDLYVATALMEHHCYRDPVAPKIFNIGAGLFPEDENFALEHLQFLVSTGDSTNARAIFQTTVSKITANPQNVHRAKALYIYFHDWESKYGELSQAKQLEAKIQELYPQESDLSLFSRRFVVSNIAPQPFEPCTVRLVISPTQIRPKGTTSNVIPSIETTEPTEVIQSGYVQSPKRPLEDSDAELPARKLMRGESPLKGAAGRRQQQRQAREGLGHQSTPSVPKPLPPAVFQLLSVIPPARQWDQTRFDAVKMTDLLKDVDTQKARLPTSNGQQYGYGYGR